MTTIEPQGSLENTTFSFKDQITPLIADLLYPSESDEKIEYFEMELSTTELLSATTFRMYTGIRPEVSMETMDIETFFKPLTKIEDWFGEDEKKWASDAQKLKDLFLTKLTDIQLFRAGQVEIDVYVFGKAIIENKWVGIKTKVIET
jgi:hypothetical protein